MLWSVLLQLILLWPVTLSSQAKPGCQETCGNISIPYPFGIGNPSCFKHPDHQLICNQTFNPPILVLAQYTNIPILDISLTGQLNISLNVAYECYNKNGTTSDKFNQNITLPKLYSFSDTRNKFTAIGCDTKAFIFNPVNQRFQSGCVSFCANSSDMTDDGSCSGIGCCQTTIPKGLRKLRLDLGSYYNHTMSWRFNPCSYAFLANVDWFEFAVSDLWSFRNNSRLRYENKTSSRVVLDWVVGLGKCRRARMNSSDYACGENSFCANSINGIGYRCYCNQGYQGNPYLPNGCQDIDECGDPKSNNCEAICNNTPGSYFCSCPHGTIDDGDQDGLRCIPLHKKIPLLQVISGIGFVLLFLLLASSYIYWIIQKRKFINLKEKFFKQNGGMFLQQLLGNNQRIETTKIFTSEELKKASNNFDENWVLGQGGYGTVYKGILPDQKLVAIKKSKTIDETQIEQFINEVRILSQINHRNVVKLLGCCLETEVPLLVYEFITNGTLFHHIHEKGHSISLSWEQRLRIAAETAGAIAYLHSAASPPIIHRDIKSMNILLDKNYRAKVADFGASRLVHIDGSQLGTLVQGTMGYLDPEYFLTSQFTEKSDVYSFGVVLVELLTGQKAVSFERSLEERNLAIYFISSMKENKLMKILDKRVLEEGNVGEILQVAQLAKSCLKLNGDERPTMKEVAMELDGLRSFGKNHPWIEKGSVNDRLKKQESDAGNGGVNSNDSLENQVFFELEKGR